MTDSQFSRDVGALLSRFPDARYDDVLHTVRRELDRLVSDGKLRFGEDHMLGGAALEARVGALFHEMGFVVERGRRLMEDFVVRPPGHVKPSTPLVLEVKSAKALAPDRDDLRQLDDWVFELSGEEEARKHGLQDPVKLEFFGFPVPIHHPSPHKGVLIFNGPVGTEFEKRSTDWLGANEREFAVKRDFCVISLPVLLNWHAFCRSSRDGGSQFWRTIHESCGLFPRPPAS